MAKKSGQKLKLLYLLKILAEETDEEHCLTTAELIERLAAQGITAERKSIYDDVEKLTEFGYDILKVQNRSGGGYYLASREFELAELKLLVDAVQSSRFITVKKSRELIRKLEKLASRYDAGKLQRQVYVAGRIKTENESVYYHIDALHRAIQENRRISFRYMEWNINKELVPRKDGQIYRVSPWALIWKDENYYLAAYDSAAACIKHFRVDKMDCVELLDSAREGSEKYESLDPAVYTNRTFGMFGGQEEQVSLLFPETLTGVVIDRFGREIGLQKQGEMVRARVSVAVSGQFFGWLAGIGSRIRIVSPDNVKEEYFAWLREILEK